MNKASRRNSNGQCRAAGTLPVASSKAARPTTSTRKPDQWWLYSLQAMLAALRGGARPSPGVNALGADGLRLFARAVHLCELALRVSEPALDVGKRSGGPPLVVELAPRRRFGLLQARDFGLVDQVITTRLALEQVVTDTRN